MSRERKIIFGHRRAIGDCLMFTCGVRDFKLLFPHIQVDVDSNFPAVWENNPYLTKGLNKNDPDVEYYRVGYPTVQGSNNGSVHFTQSFLSDMIAAADLHEPLGLSLGEFCSTFGNGRVGDPDMGQPEKNKDAHEPFISIRNKYATKVKDGGLDFLPDNIRQQFLPGDNFCGKFARQRADIHLTDKEKSYNMIQDVYGIEKYWVVAPGGKSDCTCKIWDWRRFKDVVDHFEGRIKFVVIGRSDHIVERLDGVLDLTDKFNDDIRGLFPLVYHSDGCISGISFLMHLAAAMPPKPEHTKARKPCVAIYGGREPTGFTAYTGHQVLHGNFAYFCSDNGGCWQSRVIPLPKKEDGNTRLCHNPVKDNGRTIPKCMADITSQDMIRAIEKYYHGDLYSYAKGEPKKKKRPVITAAKESTSDKKLTVLASLSSKGGGEQSAIQLVKVFRDAGWDVTFTPWGKVHKKYDREALGVNKLSYEEGAGCQKAPLLFYGNDQINAFCRTAQHWVEKCTSLIIGINYINGELPKCQWLHKTGKLKAVVFQNQEKRAEFERDRLGFEDTQQIVLHGCIDLQKYLEVYSPARKDKEPLVILKHCTPDYRKYITEESVNQGQKIHLWQKHIHKETDVKFYGRLLKDTKNTRFEFMEAHKELREAYKDEPRMVFHEWDAMPVDEFLSRGHAYLYRTSNAWRDNYPRVVAEALAAGLPVLSEPRDGTKDRMDHGEIGFSCIDYDAFVYGVRILQRKEKFRREMGAKAKEWARDNLDPKAWLEVIE